MHAYLYLQTHTYFLPEYLRKTKSIDPNIDVTRVPLNRTCPHSPLDRRSNTTKFLYADQVLFLSFYLCYLLQPFF